MPLLSLGSPSLEIERSARSQHAVVAIVLAILVGVPWWLPQFSLAMAATLAFTTCALAMMSFWRIGWLGGKRVLHKALWMSDGNWRLFDRANTSWPATLHASSQVLGTLLWLRFVSERGPREMLFLGSDLPPDTRRRLITRLRLPAAQHRTKSGGVSSGEGTGL